MNMIIAISITQGGLWISSDGTVNPSDLCQAFAKGATLKGNDDKKLIY